MHQLFLGLDQGIELAQPFFFIGAEIGDLREAPLFAQGLQDVGQIGAGEQPIFVQPPQPPIGGIEVFELAVGPEQSDRRRQLFQHVVMGRNLPRQIGLDLFEIGEIHGVAGHGNTARLRLKRDFDEFEEAPAPADDDVMAFALGNARQARPLGDRFARIADHQFGNFALLGNRRLGRSLQSLAVGLVAKDERKIRAAQPGRHREGIEQRAQPCAVIRHGFDALNEPPGFSDEPAHIAEPDEVGQGLAGGPRRPHADHAHASRNAAGSGRKRQKKIETLAAGAQQFEGSIELAHIARVETVAHDRKSRRRFGTQAEKRPELGGAGFSACDEIPQVAAIGRGGKRLLQPRRKRGGVPNIGE